MVLRRSRIRIGPEKYHYEYTQMSPFLWECSRGSDWAADGDALCLALNENGQWTAFDALGGWPVFQTDEDWTQPGWHAWRVNWDAGKDVAPRWRDGGRFLTTIL